MKVRNVVVTSALAAALALGISGAPDASADTVFDAVKSRVPAVSHELPGMSSSELEGSSVDFIYGFSYGMGIDLHQVATDWGVTVPEGFFPTPQAPMP